MNPIFGLKITLVLLCFFINVESLREISCFVNPGLNTSNEETSNADLIHIMSEGDKDVVHFVWSTYKLPSLLVARTTKDTSLSVNTTKVLAFEKDAIEFKNKKPLETLGVTFSEFWELHYQNDSTPLDDAFSVDDLNMETFVWSNISDSLTCSSTFASFNIKADSYSESFSKKGMLEIQFSVAAEQQLSEEFPHLVFTGNSTLLKFVLDNLLSNDSYTRYGFGISLFSNITDKCKSSTTWETSISKSINDEVSPGVFSDVELIAPCSDTTLPHSAFLSWRPVAYTGEKPIVANSSDVTMSDIKSRTFEIRSIAELYFQDMSDESHFNLTFGTLGDGCYASTKYTSWVMMAGTGTMMEVPLSKVVIILASVGIGLLSLFLLSGCVFITYQRCKEKDDDLLLN